MRRTVIGILIVLSAGLAACSAPLAFRDGASPEARRLASAAENQVGRTVSYDASYVKLDYPAGDVPFDRGVCTDVVVRAFRDVGTDLQVVVHEDMAAHFDEYPRNWGLTGPDSSIDHRRVPNLQTYFSRRGAAVPVTDDAKDYWPGDLVTWKVLGRPHIGIVSTVPARDGTRYCIVHNIGAGTQVEDRLFEFETPVTTGRSRPGTSPSPPCRTPFVEWKHRATNRVRRVGAKTVGRPAPRRPRTSARLHRGYPLQREPTPIRP